MVRRAGGSAASFDAKAKASGLRYTERWFRFTRLWNGLSVNANAETAQLISKLDWLISRSGWSSAR